MNIDIQSLHFTADKKLLNFIEEKVEKLTTFHDGILRSEVILKLDKSDNDENKVAEIKSALSTSYRMSIENTRNLKNTSELSTANGNTGE